MKQPRIIRDHYRETRGDEGPNPSGIINRLYRERDEARSERDKALSAIRLTGDTEREYWRAIYGFVHALQTLPAPSVADGNVTLPLSAVAAIVAVYTNATGDYEDLEAFLPDEPLEEHLP